MGDGGSSEVFLSMEAGSSDDDPDKAGAAGEESAEGDGRVGVSAGDV